MGALRSTAPGPLSQQGLRLRGFADLDTLRSVFASLGAPQPLRAWLAQRRICEREGSPYDVELLYQYMERNEAFLRMDFDRVPSPLLEHPAMLLELQFYSVGIPLMGGRVPSEAPPALVGRNVRRRTGPQGAP